RSWPWQTPPHPTETSPPGYAGVAGGRETSPERDGLCVDEESMEPWAKQLYVAPSPACRKPAQAQSPPTWKKSPLSSCKPPIEHNAITGPRQRKPCPTEEMCR